MNSLNKEYPFISVIIPTLNNEKDLIDCLDSLKKTVYIHKNLEIIVWDNGSSQKCKEKINHYLSRIQEESGIKNRLIESSENLGAHTSRDELFKRVNHEAQFILSIDDDVILPPNIFKGLLAVFDSDNKAGIVGPRTVYDDFPNETAHGAGFVNWWIGRYKDIDSGELEECDYVIGCCFLVKRDVINKLGGFDRDYYTSHGEIDFCLKAKKKGYKIIYQPSVIVKHKVEKGGTKSLERTYYIFRNKLFVIKKNAPIPQKYISLFLYFLFWLPKSILDSIIRNKSLNFQEIRIILKAILDGWLNKGGKRL